MKKKNHYFAKERAQEIGIYKDMIGSYFSFPSHGSKATVVKNETLK